VVAKGGWNQQAQRKHASCTVFRERKMVGSIHTTLQNEPGPDSHVEARHSFFFRPFSFLALRTVHLRDKIREPFVPSLCQESQRLPCTAGRLIPPVSLSEVQPWYTHYGRIAASVWHRLQGKAGGVCCNLSLTAPSLNTCSALFEAEAFIRPLTEPPRPRLPLDWHLHIQVDVVRRTIGGCKSSLVGEKAPAGEPA
jgi:hypothetical protein